MISRRWLFGLPLALLAKPAQAKRYVGRLSREDREMIVGLDVGKRGPYLVAVVDGKIQGFRTYAEYSKRFPLKG